MKIPQAPVWGLLLLLPFASGCDDDDGPVAPQPIVDDGTYSGTIQVIFERSCNSANCHGVVAPGNDLILTSWDAMIAGSRFGEAVIPFEPERSHLIEHLTGIAEPRMPSSGDPLPEGEIDIIRNWIERGAPNDAGEIPYENSQRKIYVTNQASDVISVIDADALVVMRLIDASVSDAVDSPHNVHVDRQGRYFYVTLINTAHVLQFDAATDELRFAVTVGQSPANPVASPDGGTLYVTNWNPDNATLHVLDTETMAERYMLQFPPSLGVLPHGLLVTADGSTLYTTHEQGNSVFKIELGETAQEAQMTFIPLHATGEAPLPLRPLQVILDREESFAYVTCHQTGEVRIVDLEREEMIEVIAIDGKPWLEALTTDGRQVYVANWGKNAVDVIDTQTRTLVDVLDNTGREHPVFARPHGVAVSPDGRYIFVSSENTNAIFSPHHPTETDGDPGNLAIIDAATGEVVKVLELEVDPTGVAYVGND